MKHLNYKISPDN